MIRMLGAAAAAVVGLFASASAQAQDFPGQAEFRGLYEELVEIDTTLQHGSCTRAAEAMAARLKAAGYPDQDLHVLVPPERPNDGNLVAVLHGSDPAARPIILLAHIDVVAARREDWERDPFTLVEEDGYFYGRGSFDDKAQSAIWVDTLIRYRIQLVRPVAMPATEASRGHA